MKQQLLIALVAGAMLTLPGCGTQTLQDGAEQSGTPAATSTSSPTASSSEAGPSASEKPTAAAGPERIYWEDLMPGMCFVTPEDPAAISVTVVDCRTTHDHEVIGNTDLPGTDTWPGDDAVDKAAGEQCEKSFDSYVGVDYDLSELEIDYFTTDREGWEDGDHTLICMVFDPGDESLSKSLKGSAK